MRPPGWTGAALALALTVGGLAGLFVLGKGPDERRAADDVARLRELARIDTAIEAEVLSVGSGRTRDYDRLVRLLDELDADHALAARAGGALAPLGADLAARRRLVDRFMRHHAVVRNSIEYLPTALAAAHGELGEVAGGRELLFQLSLLVTRLQDHRGATPTDVAALLDRADADHPALRQLVRHLRVVERERRAVDGYVAKLQALSRPSAYEALAAAIEARHAAAHRSAARYRGVLAALGVALLAGCAIVIVRHRRVHRRGQAQLRATRDLVAAKDRELEIASRIQTSILPRDVEIPGLEVTARMIPASEVGGDYYDVVPAWDGCWIGIGDVTGHGLNAGLIMLMVQSALAALVRQHPDAAPRTLVALLNEVVYDNVRKRLGERDHVTFSLLRYHIDGRVTFAGAHEQLVICRADGRCELIDTPGTWLGGMADVEAVTVDSECRLEPGDLMLLHTDGITESMAPSGEQYGVERLSAALAKHRHLPNDAIRDALLDEVTRWSGEQVDDRTLVIARFDPEQLGRTPHSSLVDARCLH
jgi:hypothetical protein